MINYLNLIIAIVNYNFLYKEGKLYKLVMLSKITTYIIIEVEDVIIIEIII